jgi:hypothetical protein
MKMLPKQTPDTLKIAVASDLHAFEKTNDSDTFPSHLRITAPENEPGKHPIVGLLRMIEDQNLKADLFLSPGDLGDKANPSGILYAWRAIHQIGAQLGVDLVTASSGNHDLDSRYITSADAKGFLLSLTPPYPLPDESSNNKYWARNFVIKEDDTYRLVILNSSAYHGGKPGEIDHGRIADSTLSVLQKELADREPKLINILLCHHHPQQHMELNLGDYDVMKNGQLLLDLLGSGEFGRWLIIHGHKHHPKIAYAQGGATSPIVFSAGSLCANLYLELQTMARNQFYIITLPFGDIERLGLVGRIQAWDWASGAGWAPAAGPSSGLPASCHFGYRTDPRLLANKVSALVTQAKIDWDVVREALPEITYLLPQDVVVLRKELKSLHRLEIIEVDGQPKEIGKSAS